MSATVPPPPPQSTPPSRERAHGGGRALVAAARTAELRAAMGLSALAALLIAAVCAGWQPLLDLDSEVAGALHDSALARPGWTRVNRVLTDVVWDTWTMRGLVAVVAAVLWCRAERRPALWLAVTMLAGALVQQGLKAAVGRERPEWEQPVDTAHFAAMPSGHAMTAALACGLLLWLVRLRTTRAWVRWTAAVLAAVSVTGVSFTRVYLGVHWLTDVVAAVLLGLAMAAAAAGCWRVRRPEGAPARSAS